LGTGGYLPVRVRGGVLDPLTEFIDAFRIGPIGGVEKIGNAGEHDNDKDRCS
jgi:hypothetical protein